MYKYRQRGPVRSVCSLAPFRFSTLIHPDPPASHFQPSLRVLAPTESYSIPPPKPSLPSLNTPPATLAGADRPSSRPPSQLSASPLFPPSPSHSLPPPPSLPFPPLPSARLLRFQTRCSGHGDPQGLRGGARGGGAQCGGCTSHCCGRWVLCFRLLVYSTSDSRGLLFHFPFRSCYSVWPSLLPVSVAFSCASVCCLHCCESA